MEEIITPIDEEIIALCEAKKYAKIREIYKDMQPADIAYLFSDLPKDKIPVMFRLLPKELAADTFVEMDSDVQEHLIKSFSDTEIRDVMDEIYLDDAVDIVEEMPANVVKRILANTDSDTRALINKILQYPEDSAGSIMTIEYVSLRKNMTVSEAITRVRRTGVDKETIYTCYVTDYNRTLLGIITAKDLLLSEDDAIISDIMDTNILSAHTHTDKEEVTQMFSKYNLLVLPVVDDENRLVGIVTVDDAMDVMEEEATEDIEKMAAIRPGDKPYLQTGIWSTYKARIPWLLLLMISAIFTGILISHYESALTAIPVLMASMPMLTDTGGNCGGQSSVTIIRALSLGDIDFKDILKVLWKEFRVALLCGVTLAAANAAKMAICYRTGLFGLFDVYTGTELLKDIAVVSLSLFASVIMAKIIGCTLPMLAKKLKFDPAVMSSPFITTIVDALALLIYFSIASAMLGITV